jgi:hypothetical protein
MRSGSLLEASGENGSAKGSERGPGAAKPDQDMSCPRVWPLRVASMTRRACGWQKWRAPGLSDHGMVPFTLRLRFPRRQ